MKYKLSLIFLLFIIIYGCTKEEFGIFEVSKQEKNLEKLRKTQNWIYNIQQSNGLLESAEETNFVSLYDNALASLVFISEGKFDKAEKIFDFFNTKVTEELLNKNGGFYQYRDKYGENGGRTWMGDNAWLLIALNNYHNATKTQKYKLLASALENWLRSLQDIDGGLWGGYTTNGNRIHKITEGIITAFNAVEGYDDFHKNILSYLKQNRWNTNDQLLIAWPDNPAYYYAMDLHSLGYTIFNDFPEEVLYKANSYINTQITTATKQQITGYCFDLDNDVIWLEGTAQMAVAYQQAGYYTEANAILLNLEKTFIKSTLHNQAIGIPYTSNGNATSYSTEVLWNHAATKAAISSTAWYLFAKTEFNPFKIGQQKNIPDSDKFWLDPLPN